ncbi:MULTISPECIES: glycosyltransferase family 4 protein [unclassified Colwellia]|uniref:glycosyltransferase family 4 protein n=1 Tax=unclassified Colwellia TaxID=196834 RepID=UPI0015F54487|nr:MULTISPECIES: glycosyltransferase [unclassified Colwellia]MBA6257122.1 glycosyltransferase [Colwellia sp. MB3u-28]MBA6258646.1 glycosyltransferase [Colwellia sp. MB3u-41]
MYIVSFCNFKKLEGSESHAINIIKNSVNSQGVKALVHVRSKEYLDFSSDNVIYFGSKKDRVINSTLIQTIYYIVKYYSFFSKYFQKPKELFYFRLTMALPIVFLLYNFMGFLGTKKRVVVEHNGILELDGTVEKKRLFTKPILRFVQLWCSRFGESNRAVTSQIAEYIKGNVQADVFVLGNGYDSTAFCEYTKPILSQVSQNPFVITFVGNLVKWQGVDTLIHAAALLKDRKILVKIIGDGAERNHLEALVDELYLQDAVQFLGRLDKPGIIDVFHNSNVLCAPFSAGRNSKVGNSALKIREYLATGLPIVCSDIPYDLKMDEKAELFIPDNRELLAEVLLRVKVDYQTYFESSDKNLHFAKEFLSWSAIAEKLIKELHEVENQFE